MYTPHNPYTYSMMQKRSASSSSNSTSSSADVAQLNPNSLKEAQSSLSIDIRCNLLTQCAKLEFKTYLDYESHYQITHTYTCIECQRILLSQHYLQLHITEKHDPFVALTLETKPNFECFLSRCKELFMNSKDRKHHCLKVHGFEAISNFVGSNSNKGKQPLQNFLLQPLDSKYVKMKNGL